MSDVKTFALDSLERAGKSIGQGIIAGLALVLPSVDGAHLVSGAWWAQVLVAAGVGGVMGLASLVTSIASAAKTGTASLSRTVAGIVAPVIAVPDPALGAPVMAPDPAPVPAESVAVAPVPTAAPTVPAV